MTNQQLAEIDGAKVVMSFSDPYAEPAITAYARACYNDNPVFATALLQGLMNARPDSIGKRMDEAALQRAADAAAVKS